MKNKNKYTSGMSLIELLIVIGLLGFVLLNMMSMMMYQQEFAKNNLINSVFLSDIEEIKMLTLKPASCLNAFREDQSNLVTFDPDNVNTYTNDFQYLYFGNKIVLQNSSLAPENSPNNKFSQYYNVTKLQLKSKGLTENSSTRNINGAILPVNVHYVDLVIEANRSGGTLKNHPLKRSIAISLLTDPVTKKVLSCEVDRNSLMNRATAIRSGFTINDRTCAQEVPPSLYEENACPDVDGNTICDNNSSLTTIAHPGSTEAALNTEWNKYFPTRKSGTPPLNGVEGRCWVDIKSNSSLEDPKDIFKIYNALPGEEADGLGCNAADGWFVVSCFRMDYGMGDADTSFKVDNDGNEYCLSNDYTQPHTQKRLGDKPWLVLKVVMSVICGRLDFN